MRISSESFAQIDDLVRRYPSLAGCEPAVAGAVETIVECQRSGGKLMVCGNGGSASDAEHIVGELAKSFAIPRPLPESDRGLLRSVAGEEGAMIAGKLERGIRAMTLTGHSALATAIQNDIGGQLVFAQMTYVLGQPGDVLLGLSTSGNSKNVVSALIVARAFGIRTIGLTGAKDCRMDSLCDIIIKAPETETYKVQELHLPIYHAICLAIETELFQVRTAAEPLAEAALAR